MHVMQLQGMASTMKKKVESKHNNKDMKMALKHDIPLEVLQEGIPTVLRGAPDNEVQAGRVIRVSSATGLKEALQQAGPGALLKVYVVSYIPPSAAAQIREMTTTTRGGKEAQEKKPSASATIAKAQPQPHDQETATAPPQPTKSLSAPFKFKVKLRSHSKAPPQPIKRRNLPLSSSRLIVRIRMPPSARRRRRATSPVSSLPIFTFLKLKRWLWWPWKATCPSLKSSRRESHPLQISARMMCKCNYQQPLTILEPIKGKTFCSL
ncbi:hypothetical protein DAI22_07g123900 [Oryza sativa Japonica Group]|uniref:cDNA clone:J023048O19, full insert sequence n=2 Tax=Oryza sativa subsp. japonica TaxID=39947 RepID=B7EHU4_ORYSJ|nr:uncharacterized protein LOC107277059 [Oryza sativa Japonica Group]KAF2922582.1 hypothetical protein DAI22_07g123900 [Oryza sativa Japonica Group]BAG91941.1 unnamed protein product [Oryza sativa Japonica Group]